MRGINKVILVGHLGKDPEVQNFEGGNMLAKFSLATTEVYKEKSGNRAEKTEWHNISVWGKQAEIASKFLKKGSLIYLEGRIRSRDYVDKDGNQRRAYDIICDRFSMLDRKQDSSTGGGATQPAGEVDTAEPIDDLPF
ncbi:MAG: single-stranded DNA-binding protein [Chitinophagales bacterium]|jgi:single-strand DNA-binding protein|nr:single-stranded DNA-binding protein [Bacteroidota bacterium]MBX7141671.1 single-stranded DNA-binding protein [Chitinophagales bacterium]